MDESIKVEYRLSLKMQNIVQTYMINHIDLGRNPAEGNRSLGSLIRSKKIVFGGHKKAKIYGLLNCFSGKRMKVENRVFFGKEVEALANGYRPCGNCLPEKYKKWNARRNTGISFKAIMDKKNLLPFDGEIYFFPELFQLKESEDIFEALTKNIEWVQEPIKIMGQEIMQPRLTSWYGDDGMSYRYSGITMNPLAWTDDLWSIKYAVENVSGEIFNSALLNFYRDGNDSVGWHRDNEKFLGINPTIGSISFGETRTFSLKHIKDRKQKIKIALNNGSLLLMKGPTQHNWLHSIQKDSAITRPRINITFRTIKEIL